MEVPARDLGLPAGIPIVLGRADTPASHLGSGSSLNPADVIVTLGTGGQLCQILGEPPASPPEGLLTLVGPYDHTYYVMAPVYAAGLALDWIRNLFGLSWQQFYDSAFSGRLSNDAPIFFPFKLISSQFGRAHYPAAAWEDLRPYHDPAHLLASGLEGVAFMLRLARDLMLTYEPAAHFDNCTLIGGGSKDSRVRQLVADVLGVTVHCPDIVNASARGAALTAGVAGSWFQSLPEACQAFSRQSSPITPSLAATEAHDQRFARFQEIINSEVSYM